MLKRVGESRHLWRTPIVDRVAVIVDGRTSSTLGSPVVVCVYNLEQYSVHLFRMSCFSVRHSPALSWIVVVLPSFKLVSFFTSWKAFLLLFFCRFSSIPLALFFSPCLLCFSHAFFNLLVGFSIKFCVFSRILLLFQFSLFVAQL